jgi:hypothetical protein
MSKSIELNVTLLIRPETDDTQTLVTISNDSGQLICHTLPVREALQNLQYEITRLLEDAERARPFNPL